MATRTISAAGGNFDSTLSWVEGIVPVAGDDVIALPAGGSGNLTVNVASGGVGLNSFIMPVGHTSALIMNNTLTVVGTFTLVSTMTVSGTAGTLILQTTGGTLTSAGRTITFAVTFLSTVTWTLADNWNVNGLVSIGAGGNTVTINGFQITLNGGLRFSGTSGSSTGTTNFIVTAGTLDAPSISSGRIQNNITTNGAGNITISGTFGFRTGTWTHTAGNVITTGSTLQISASTTMNTAGIIWNIVNIVSTGTITLSSLLTATTIGLGTGAATSIITMAGTAGFTCTSLTQTTISSAPATLKLVSGLTYTVDTITFPGCPGQANTLVSVTASSPAYLYLTGTQADVSYVSVTDISVLGRTMYVYKGTLLRTSGVAVLPNVAGIMRPMPIRGI